MKSFVLLTALTLGMTGTALAETPVQAGHNQVTQTEASTVQNANVEMTPVAHERVTVTRTRSNAPLKGDTAWWIAGIAGAAVPLVLFALPALFLGVFGPFAPIAFLAAVVVAALTTGLGGAVAWAIQAIFSDLKSGFLVPILGSAATGLAITFVGGTLATLVIAGGVGLAWLVSGAGNIWNTVRPDNIRNIFNSRQGPIMAGATTLGALTWAVSVVVGSIAGPLVGAYLYRANGEPKYVEESVTVNSNNRDYYRGNTYDNRNTYVVPNDAQPLPQ